MVAMRGFDYSRSISRILKLREVNSAHKLWRTLSSNDALLSKVWTDVGTTWTETVPEQGVPQEWESCYEKTKETPS